MDKEIARGLIALAIATDAPIGKMFELVERLEEGEMKSRLKQGVGDIMGAIFFKIIAPIEALYPDLNPDNAR